MTPGPSKSMIRRQSNWQNAADLTRLEYVKDGLLEQLGGLAEELVNEAGIGGFGLLG